MKDDKQKNAKTVVNGFFWVSCGRGAQALTQFFVIVILARLISPSEFGVVSAAMIVIVFSEIFTELGLATAIVQRKHLREQHLSTGFFVSIVLTIFAGGFVFIIAPYIAGFFGSPEMEPVVKALALLFPLRGVGAIGEALAQREMRFRWLAASDVFSFGAGFGLFGVFPALLGYGVWALVSANLATAVFKTAFLLLSYPPRSLRFRWQAFKELLDFGGGHTLARFANFAALQGDNFIVGRFLGMEALGIYGRAYQLTGIPASVIGQILDKVLFPSMSKIQDRQEKLAAVFMRGASLIATMTLPLSVVGFIVAPEIVNVILGEKWGGVTLPFRILLLGLMLRSSYKFCDLLAKSTGAVYRRAWRQGIYAGTVIVGGWFGHFWGIPGVATGIVAAVALNFILMAQMSLSLIGKTWMDLGVIYLRPIMLATIAASVIYPATYFGRSIGLNSAGLLAGTALIFLAGFSVVVKYAPALFLGREGIWALNLFGSYLPKRLQTLLLSEHEEYPVTTIRAKNASIESA